jgi:drug/metabolite transporter (DMT)-like permease
MLEFLPALGSLLSYGSVSPSSKKAINELGRHKSIVYAYLAMVVLLLLGAVVLNISIEFPEYLLPGYLLQIVIGGLGAITAYKALDYGKASITSPISKVYVILVLAISIVFLGEQLTAGQVTGSLLMVGAAIVLALDSKGELKPKKWMLYLGISMLCRVYYYTFIKTFVTELGPYLATLSLELGIVVFVIAFHAVRGRDLSPPKISKVRFAAVSGTLIFFGSLAYSLSVAYIGAALTAAISAGTPIVNAAVSYFLLKEKLDTYKYAAIILVVLGLTMIVLF